MSGAEHVEAILKHKAEGNECYKNKDYEGAIKSYGLAAKLLPRFPYDDDSDDEGGPSAAEIVAKMDPEMLKQGAVGATSHFRTACPLCDSRVHV